MAGEEIKFRNGDEILTLWVERHIPPVPIHPLRFVVGWCPELQNTMFVAQSNVVEEAESAG